MFTTRIVVEIAPFGSIKHVQAISSVAGSVTVNKIKINGETITVCNIHQFFQLFRCSVATVISTKTTACHSAICICRLFKNCHT